MPGEVQERALRLQPLESFSYKADQVRAVALHFRNSGDFGETQSVGVDVEFFTDVVDKVGNAGGARRHGSTGSKQ